MPTPSEFARYEADHPLGYDTERTSAMLHELADGVARGDILLKHVLLVGRGDVGELPSYQLRINYWSAWPRQK